jgi:hypothetical protein
MKLCHPQIETGHPDALWAFRILMLFRVHAEQQEISSRIILRHHLAWDDISVAYPRATQSPDSTVLHSTKQKQHNSKRSEDNTFPNCYNFFK